MILGDYPCCDGPLNLPVPETAPLYERERCPHCGAVVWHLLSRLDPKSWTEADFLEEYEVDQDTKSVKRRAIAGGDPS